MKLRLIECIRNMQEDTVKGTLWREALVRSLGSHDAVEPVGRGCHGYGYREGTNHLHTLFLEHRRN